MPLRLEDYALIGDMESAALVGNDGSIDWLCWPRFDSDACFAALLGEPAHGRWRLAPSEVRAVTRRYRPDTLVLETTFDAGGGRVRVVDCMPPREGVPNLVRVVEGLSGRVRVDLDLRLRFGYGRRTPWLRRLGGGLEALAGPDAVILRTAAPYEVDGAAVRSSFEVSAGDRVAFDLTWYPSHLAPPGGRDPLRAADETERWWTEWARACRFDVGPWRDVVVRSLITLKALTFAPTGGIVAAPTTSLPEWPGGVRNWDYRYCWVRDATLTLTALVDAGYRDEAAAWRDWLLRAVAGEPDEMQIMYGVAGERRLVELELPWLPGYEGSRPVRIGNAASGQLQLDVYGEVMDCLLQAADAGLPPAPDAWELQRRLVEVLERRWDEPDEGIWEIRAERQHFTHSKVMAWVALDRAIRHAERLGADAPLDRWRALRAHVHAEACRRGYDPERGSFVQREGSRDLDASLLVIPSVGFLPPRDPRVLGTIDAIRRELCVDGLVRRYDSARTPDGLPPGEGVFLACSFWLVDALALAGRRAEAVELFERLLSLRNDVGLLAEEYEPGSRRLVGNFPQAFSHVGLIGSAEALARAEGPAIRRSR